MNATDFPTCLNDYLQRCLKNASKKLGRTPTAVMQPPCVLKGCNYARFPDSYKTPFQGKNNTMGIAFVKKFYPCERFKFITIYWPQILLKKISRKIVYEVISQFV